MTKLAKLISQMEGFGKPGAVPTTHNNPGDLRSSPHSTHTPDNPHGIGWIATLDDGWADLERQLQLYASRKLTLSEVINLYAPPVENNTGHYLDFVCKGLGCGPHALVSDVLRIPA